MTDAKGFVDSRSRDGISEMKEVLNSTSLKNKLPKSVEKILSLNSRFYSVYIKARYREMTYYLHSRLARDKEGRVTVISRESGQYPRWVATLRESVR